MKSQRLSLAIVISAAGRGVRFESGLAKQYVALAGVPIVQRSAEALCSCGRVDALVLVVNQEQVEGVRKMAEDLPGEKVVAVVAGGEERALSVRAGLRALADAGRWDLVGVHDGVRPLVTCEEVERGVVALEGEADLDGIVLGIPSGDTIKTVDEDGVITGTPERCRLWRAQTPQIFRWEVLMSAYAQSEETLRSATDDSSLVEISGGRVKVVEGSPENLKITERNDMRRAEDVLAHRKA